MLSLFSAVLQLCFTVYRPKSMLLLSINSVSFIVNLHFLLFDYCIILTCMQTSNQTTYCTHLLNSTQQQTHSGSCRRPWHLHKCTLVLAWLYLTSTVLFNLTCFRTVRKHYWTPEVGSMHPCYSGGVWYSALPGGPLWPPSPGRQAPADTSLWYCSHSGSSSSHVIILDHVLSLMEIRGGGKGGLGWSTL